MKKIICACLSVSGLVAAAKNAEGPVVTAVGAGIAEGARSASPCIRTISNSSSDKGAR